jgi:hypothetical protein
MDAIRSQVQRMHDAFGSMLAFYGWDQEPVEPSFFFSTIAAVLADVARVPAGVSIPPPL